MKISVVIPTHNRKDSLFRLLDSLMKSSYQITETIIVDSSDEELPLASFMSFESLNITYISSAPSVCAQRNIGIQRATSEWIFLCDDDLEVPIEYLQKLADHIKGHNECGAISGAVLQKERGEWVWQYPVTSTVQLVWRYMFQLSIWGQLRCGDNFFTKRIKKIYKEKGNHISKGGWPVITDISTEYFVTPIYGLGASLVKKEWLLASPYDEVLDRHGIGDNYGVALGFPTGITVLSSAFVYHHVETNDRLPEGTSYYLRIQALYYFIKKSERFSTSTEYWLVWSLFGNALKFLVTLRWRLFFVSCKAVVGILFKSNPYWHKSIKTKV